MKQRIGRRDGRLPGFMYELHRLYEKGETVMRNEKSQFNNIGIKKHLPMMGVGPIYGAVIIAITVIAVIAGKSTAFEAGGGNFLKIPLLILGILLIVLGVYLWAGALFQSKIDSHIAENRLATTGVYGLVRNPIYSAFMFFCTGALMIAGNLFFLPLFFFYWIFMTVLMKCTEEKWLKSLYGREYEEYCRRVNRCIPWIPKGNGGKETQI